MNNHVEKLKNAASFIAFFKGSTDEIDEVISELSGQDYHTPREHEDDAVFGSGQISSQSEA